MMLQIAVITISLAILFLLNDIRRYTREMFLLGVINGLLIVHYVHLVFEEFAGTVDYSLVVNATFTMLYIPLFSVFPYVLSRNRKVITNWFIAGVGIFLIFVWCYYEMFMLRSMAAYSFANVIWHAEIVSVLIIAQNFWSFVMKTEKRSGSYQKIFGIVSVYFVIVLAPYALQLASYTFPPDNFLIPYPQVILSKNSVHVLTMVLLLIIVLRLLVFKKVMEQSRLQKGARRWNYKIKKNERGLPKIV
jgi:hypothetical protein